MIEVVAPGLLSTLQDLGRSGFQRFGVPVGGAMDEWSHRVANLLVGNSQDEATLEITLMGPTLVFTQPALIAITGADLSPHIGEHTVPQRTPLLVRAGTKLEFGRPVTGMRSYLAVHGGFVASPVMGSKSTYLRGRFGGIDGRALRQGDVLSVPPSDPEGLLPDHPLEVPPPPAPSAGTPTLRVIVGQQWDAFTAAAQRELFDAEFRLSPQSDRIGFRLEGPKLLLKEPLEMISEPVAFGTIQVPPDGDPIVLMADRPTTGGYPKLASVASVDLPLLAQMTPQQTARFCLISLEEAQRLYLARERVIADLARRT